MAELILVFILFIPVYGVLLWSYFDPEESMLWGKRWMYEEEPEISEGAIRYTKMMSLVVMAVITLVFVILFFTRI
ncbi:hypothetical protein J7I93_01430 [Bacillus sp. ISL-47]|uniref:hypothetical protein n=1 Tax=Bacillus sp. ISL-47 TaxID=2819130 RepID=UPI001BEC3560|nr:hypothetical protein [Bacillus sp. ISL-47]MBT2686837.1 hypothetical protein [Bacillus sp. ISL-47]MBT2706810.1 hypothetical protein [Pseudomonas sp. ISL-84]